jgi:hypothetical protein
MALKKLLVLKPFTTKEGKNRTLVLNGDIIYGEEVSYNTGEKGYDIFDINNRQYIGTFHKGNKEKLKEYFEEK